MLLKVLDVRREAKRFISASKYSVIVNQSIGENNGIYPD